MLGDRSDRKYRGCRANIANDLCSGCSTSYPPEYVRQMTILPPGAFSRCFGSKPPSPDGVPVLPPSLNQIRDMFRSEVGKLTDDFSTVVQKVRSLFKGVNEHLGEVRVSLGQLWGRQDGLSQQLAVSASADLSVTQLFLGRLWRNVLGNKTIVSLNIIVFEASDTLAVNVEACEARDNNFVKKFLQETFRQNAGNGIKSTCIGEFLTSLWKAHPLKFTMLSEQAVLDLVRACVKRREHADPAGILNGIAVSMDETSL